MKHKTLLAALCLVLLASGASATAVELGRSDSATRLQLERVRQLAQEVDERARGLHRGAERFAGHDDFRERLALDRLQELENKARNFHRQVERSGQNLDHTELDFRDLQKAFTRASYSLHGLHTLRRIDRRFERLSDAMFELEMYAEDLFYGATPVRHRHRYRRYRDWDDDSDSDWRRDRRQARIVLPRFRVEWDWLDL